MNLLLLDNSAFIFMVFFFIYASIVSVYNISYEAVFRLRRNISYKNFDLYSSMYNQQPNIYNQIAIVGVFVLSIIYILVFVWSNVVNFYLYLIIPIDLLMGLFFYYELTRKDYNIGINEFKNYYRVLKSQERIKSSLLNNIYSIENDFKDVHKQLNASFEKLNSILPNPEKEEEIKGKVNEYLNEYKKAKDDLLNHNIELISKFNESIRSYVMSGVSINLEISEYQDIDLNKFRLNIANMKSMYKQYMIDFATEKITTQAILKDDDLISIMEILLNLKYKFKDEDVYKILNLADKNIQNKSKVANYMLRNEIISLDLFLTTIIHNDWDWCFNRDYIFDLGNKNIYKIYENIIEKDAKKCCKKILSYKSLDQENILDRVLANTTITNSSLQLIKFQRIIMNNSHEFSDQGTMYENMAIALKGYHIASKTGNSEYNSICKDESYYINKDKIYKDYIEVSEKIQDKCQRLTDILMCYFDGVLANSDYVDCTALMNFYLENLLTLNYQSLRYLNLLLSACVLAFDKSQKNINTAIKAISSDSFVKSIFDETANNELIGKKIIKKLLKERLSIIIAIVNRTEKKRQSLDLLMGI